MILDKFKFDDIDNEFTLCEMGFGDVAIAHHGSVNDDGSIYFWLMNVAEPKEVGCTCKHGLSLKQYGEEIRLGFLFHDVKSIDVIIDELTLAKEKLNNYLKSNLENR